jgi:hypothetical protein
MAEQPVFTTLTSSQSFSLVHLALVTILIAGLLNFHEYTVEAMFHRSDARAMMNAAIAITLPPLLDPP